MDALSLRVVDHDPGAELVPDARGGILALERGVAPSGRPLPAGPGEAAGRGRRRRPGSFQRPPVGLRRLGPRAFGRRAPERRRRAEYPRPSGTVPRWSCARGRRLMGPAPAPRLELHGATFGLLRPPRRAPSARAAFEAGREREVVPTLRLWDGRGGGRSVPRDLPCSATRQAAPLNSAGPTADGPDRIDGPAGLWSLDRASSRGRRRAASPAAFPSDPSRALRRMARTSRARPPAATAAGTRSGRGWTPSS